MKSSIFFENNHNGSIKSELKRDAFYSGDQHIADEAHAMVRKYSLAVKNAMASNCLRDVLRESSQLIAELRTSALGLPNYSELYSAVIKELQYLYTFFLNMKVKRIGLVNLYELVQQAGNIVPRLYLVIIVGAICVIKNQLPPQVVLKDFIELCKGVQHPLRGLFLRHFLLKMSRKILFPGEDQTLSNVTDEESCLKCLRPDVVVKAQAPEEVCLVEKEIIFDFLCSNYAYSLRLWKRFIHSNSLFKNLLKEHETQLISTFVASNLICMVQTNCISPDFFRDVALKRIMEPLLSGRDSLLQQYLIELVVEIFNEECHIEGLLFFISSVSQLSSQVDVPAISSKLIVKLQKYLGRLNNSPNETLHGSIYSSPTNQKTLTPCQSGDAERPESVIPSDEILLEYGRHMNLSTGCSLSRSERGAGSQDGVSQHENEAPQEYRFEVMEAFGNLDGMRENRSEEECLQNKEETQQSCDQGNDVKENVSICSIGKNESKKEQKGEEGENVMECKALSVFYQIKSGLMEIIQLAHAEGFGHQSKFKQNKSSISTSLHSETRSGSTMTRLNIFLLLETFLNFTISLFPGRLDLINTIYSLMSPVLLNLQDDQAKSNETQLTPNNQAEQLAIAKLFAMPLTFPTHIEIFSTSIYSSLLFQLNNQNKPYVFQALCNALVSLNVPIENFSHLELIFWLGNATASGLDELQEAQRKNWIQTQLCFAKMIHLLSTKDTDTEFTLSTMTWNYLMSQHPDSFQFVIPSFVSRVLTFFFNIQTNEMLSGIDVSCPETQEDKTVLCEEECEVEPELVSDSSGVPSYLVTAKQVLQLVYTACMTLMKNNAEMGYRVILTAAEATYAANLRQPNKYVDILTEFLRQALVCYEEYLTENKSHVRALTPLVGLVVSMSSVLDIQVTDPMSEALTRYSARLLRTSEQCLAILQCSHLFWNENDKEKYKVFRIRECLERSLKLVLGSLQYSLNDIGLLVEVLSTYLYFFERSPQTVPANTLSHLISLCVEQLEYAMDVSSTSSTCQENILNTFHHLKNIIVYICKRQASHETIYLDIILPDSSFLKKCCSFGKFENS